MDFSFSPEQRDLADVVRSLLTSTAPETELYRHLGEPGAGRRTWDGLAEIGVPGLAVPEAHGGSGAGVTELGVVFVELGRVLAIGSYLSSIGLASTALLAADDEVAAELLPTLASGERTATLAVRGEDGTWDATHPRVGVTSDGTTLRGVTSFVLDGATADVLLVAASGPDGPGLHAVDRAAAGDAVRVEDLETLDPTRAQARVELHDAPARRVGDPGWGPALVERARLVGSVLLAAEQVGAAERVLETTVEYARGRLQFGRAIGSFQAVKHQCAEMLLRLEAARSASTYALWAADHAPDRLVEAAAIAGSYCTETATFCAGRGVQLHGGIGFTWEHPAHLYLRRARSAQDLLGSPRARRAELADAVGF